MKSCIEWFYIKINLFLCLCCWYLQKITTKGIHENVFCCHFQKHSNVDLSYTTAAILLKFYFLSECLKSWDLFTENTLHFFTEISNVCNVCVPPLSKSQEQISNQTRVRVRRNINRGKWGPISSPVHRKEMTVKKNFKMHSKKTKKY